jgi:hypothetical protein
MKRGDFIAIFNDVYARVKTRLIKITFIIFAVISFVSIMLMPFLVVMTKEVKPERAGDVSLMNMFTFLNFFIFALFLVIVVVVYLNTIANGQKDFLASLDKKSGDDIRNDLAINIKSQKKYLVLFLVLLLVPAFISLMVTLVQAVGPFVYSRVHYYINIVPAVVFLAYTLAYLPTNGNLKRLNSGPVND